MFKFMIFGPPNPDTYKCSLYTKINYQTKRYTNTACGPQSSQQCLAKTLCNCSSNGNSSPVPTYNSNNTKCPFIYQQPTTRRITLLGYEISIQGKNTTSFNDCNPTTTLKVECTGLFLGYFPGTQIDTSTFGSSAVKDVEIYTGIDGTVPNPLVFLFNVPAGTKICPNGYTGVCKVTVNGNTTNLIQSGLNGIDWIWDSNNSVWYSTIIIEGSTIQEPPPPNGGLYYNVKPQINFTLNANTDDSKGQTWLQMNAKMQYNSSPLCYNSDEATVSGKMQSITSYPL